MPTVTPFFHAPTGTWSYVVTDPSGRQAAVIDPVLDYDWRSARTGTASAQAILDHLKAAGLELAWILETHAHADHLSSAAWLQSQAGGKLAIGRGILAVQATFKRIFGLGEEFVPDGRQFDRLLADGDALALGALEGRVIATPGHTSDSVSYLFGDALFVGDTVFMPDSGSARCDFPGGDAAELYRSVQRLYGLPPATRVFVCHDYSPRGSPAAPRDQHRSAAQRQHPPQGRHARIGLRGPAPRARRHARRAEPDHPVGAGEHPSRPAAAGRVRRRQLSQGAARRGRPAPAVTQALTQDARTPHAPRQARHRRHPRAGPRMARRRRDPACGRPRGQRVRLRAHPWRTALPAVDLRPAGAADRGPPARPAVRLRQAFADGGAQAAGRGPRPPHASRGRHPGVEGSRDCPSSASTRRPAASSTTAGADSNTRSTLE